MRDYLGHTIVNGELRFASVSSVKLYDPHTKGGCPRRWASRYVFGLKEPDSDYVQAAKDAGIALDKEVKHYLRTGEKNLSALALKGLHILETPGPDLGLDVAINTVSYFRNGQPFAALPEGQRYPSDVQVVIRSELTAAGVPFVGELDIIHGRGHYRDDDGEFYADPPGTIEVADLKFKSNAKDREGNSTFFMPSDLVRDVQMAGYGEWVGRVRPNASNIRLSHLYFPKKGAFPTKVTRLHVLDDCRRTWEYVDTVVGEMKQVAKETNIERVPGATGSCDAYGGCCHREYCTAYKRSSLDALYNKIADDHVQEKTMGLLASNPQMMQQPQQSAPPMQAQLAEEEAQMRAQAAQQQQQMPQAPITPQQLLAVCVRLGSYGFGMPSLGGNLAMAYAAAGGQSVMPGYVFQGIAAPPGAKRTLHGLHLTEIGNVLQLESELAAERAASQPAPQPQYAPVAQMQQGFTQQLATAYNQQIAPQPVAGGILPPGAPESMPQLAQVYAQQPSAPAQQQTIAQPEAAAPAKAKGRPKKASAPAPEAQTAAAPPPPAGPPPATSAATQVPPVQMPAYPVGTVDPTPVTNQPPFLLLINARSDTHATKSLAGYVDYINETVARKYNTTKDGRPGPLDVRAAVDGSGLGYGGWKGYVREIVKVDPPPPGDYHFDTFMSELNEVIADALRWVWEKNGWLCVRGVRA